MAFASQKRENLDANLNGGDTTSGSVAQVFTPYNTGKLYSVTFKVYKINSPADELLVKLVSTNPSGSLLATSDSVSASLISGSATEQVFSFSSPYTLISNTPYALILSRNPDVNDSTNAYKVRVIDVVAYGGGNLWLMIPGWTEFTDRDAYFIAGEPTLPNTSFYLKQGFQ